eukprot:SAG22_NODE_18665_length_283_cov_0.842391_1_plen_30_part_10
MSYQLLQCSLHFVVVRRRPHHHHHPHCHLP